MVYEGYFQLNFFFKFAPIPQTPFFFKLQNWNWDFLYLTNYPSLQIKSFFSYFFVMNPLWYFNNKFDKCHIRLNLGFSAILKIWLIPWWSHKVVLFLHERSALQSFVVRRSTGNDVSGPLFSPLFFSPFSILCPDLFS